MNTWDDRMSPRPPAPPPQFDHIMTFFRGRMVGGTGRVLRCALYDVQTGLELRVEYEDREDLIRSELVPGRDLDRIAELASEWRAALDSKGFNELRNIAPVP